MGERGIRVDHTTQYRWVQRYAPELKKKVERYQGRSCSRWFLDETYVKVKGKWTYLYHAIDEHRRTLDFYLSQTRNTKAAKRFLGKLFNKQLELAPSKNKH